MDAIGSSWLSLLPAIITISLAFATRQVLVSLFAGVAVGGVILFMESGLIDNINIVKVFLLPTLGSEAYAVVLLIYLWCLGGILGIWSKTGSALFFSEHLGKKLAIGPRTSLLFAWLLGLVFHQGGTISTILTGTTVKPVADYHKISHEELAYVVDSTASPVAALVPFNAWPLLIGGLVIGTIPLIDTNLQAYTFYISSIPFNFYSIIAITFTLLFALNLMPWVGKSMAKARIRARKHNLLDRKGAEPLLHIEDQESKVAKGYTPSLYAFLVPIIILLLLTIVPFILWKLNLISDKHSNWTNEAFLLSTISAIVIAKLRGMSLHDIMEGYVEGCKEMTMGAMILGLALTMGLVAKELHTADYLSSLLSSGINPIFLPMMLTFLCMIVAFSTGTSLGTYAVIFPIAMPLAYALNPDPTFVKVCFGAVLGGAVFGDQCSPISDTTILSSMFTGCDLMDHVKTQLPMALTAAGIGMLLSTLVAYFFT